MRGLNVGLESNGCVGDTAQGCSQFGSGMFGDHLEGPLEPPHPLLCGWSGRAAHSPGGSKAGHPGGEVLLCNFGSLNMT